MAPNFKPPFAVHYSRCFKEFVMCILLCEHSPVASCCLLTCWSVCWALGIFHFRTGVALNCKFCISCFWLIVYWPAFPLCILKCRLPITWSCTMQRMNCGTNLHASRLVNNLEVFIFLVWLVIWKCSILTGSCISYKRVLLTDVMFAWCLMFVP